VRRRARPPRGERGSSSILVVGVLAGLLCLTASLLAVDAALVVRQRVANAADAAALAAADAASGALPGAPCVVAATAARLGGVGLGACDVSPPYAEITAESRVLGIPVRVAARAGPPP
jgi:secretion/DNA translocation related TadE-like protein